MEFIIYNNSKQEKIEILEIERVFVDCARIHAIFRGYETNSMLVFKPSAKYPLLQFDLSNGVTLTIELNSQKLIDYVWDNIDNQTTGELYKYTSNYKANYCD